MYLTGFADEAANGFDGQIKATKELGWKYIESRNIDGKNIHDLSDADFDIVYGKLKDAGIEINCFGSAIGNWAKQINQPLVSSLEEAKRAIPRMKRLDTQLIRVMSFALIPGKEPQEQMVDERFQRMRVLQKIFSDEGLIMVHENCANYGGMGWPYTLELLENVPGLKLVYDTGNPITDDDYSKPIPHPKQSSWEFYTHVKKHIAYVHIKDGIWDKEKKKPVFTFPGEGEGDVRKIVTDILASGYDGGFSIEPHMAVLAHDKSVTSEDEIRYSNYVEYGKRMMKLLDECKAALTK
jgi:sugar phosphate isomerase/epimerase